MRALARRPDDRFATAEAFRTALLGTRLEHGDEHLMAVGRADDPTVAGPRPTDSAPTVIGAATGTAVSGGGPRRPDDTPGWGTPAVSPRGRRRIGPGVVVSLAVVVALVLVALLVATTDLGHDLLDRANPSAPDTPDPAQLVSIASAHPFDPQGDVNEENDELAGAAVDSQPSTGWRTETYESPRLREPQGRCRPGRAPRVGGCARDPDDHLTLDRVGRLGLRGRRRPGRSGRLGGTGRPGRCHPGRHDPRPRRGPGLGGADLDHRPRRRAAVPGQHQRGRDRVLSPAPEDDPSVDRPPGSLTAIAERDVTALVEAAQAGDRPSLDALLRAHIDQVHALCRRICTNRADAEDATQEALIAIVRGLPRFDGRSSFSTWVHRVATNACLDEIRRRGRRPKVVGRADAAPADDDDRGRFSHDPADPEPGVADRLPDRLALDAALAELPEDFRVPVVLRDQLGLDYAEIAEVLGLPPGTVRSRISRGRSRLADLLTGDDEGNPEPADDVQGTTT